MKRSGKIMMTFLLITVLILSLLVGCSGSESKKNEESSVSGTKTQVDNTSNTQESKVEIPKITMYLPVNPGAHQNEYGPEWKVHQWIKEKFGFELTVRIVKDDPVQELTIAMASGDIPDVFSLPSPPKLFTDFVNNKFCKDITKYFNDSSNYPNLAKIPKELLAFSTVDGKVLGAPSAFGMSADAYEGEVMVTLGMYKSLPGILGINTPETLEDFINALKTVRDKNAKGPMGIKMFPFGCKPNYLMVLGDRIFGQDTTNSDAGLVFDKNNKIIPNWGSKERYESLKLLNLMWREKLIDPELFTQKDTLFNEKMANTRYAFQVYDNWDAWYWMEAAVGKGDDPQAKEYLEKNELVTVPIIKANNYDSTAIASATTAPESFCIVSSKLSDTAADKLFKYFDWVVTDEGTLSVYYGGWPGETFKMENGKAKVSYPWKSYQEAAKEGAIWHYNQWTQFVFARQYAATIIKTGSDLKRPDDFYWKWLYHVQKDVREKPEYLAVQSPLSKLMMSSEEKDIDAQIQTIWKKHWANVITAGTEADFEKRYGTMIKELLGTKWRELCNTRQKVWDEFSAKNPSYTKMTFPRSNALDEIAKALGQ